MLWLVAQRCTLHFLHNILGVPLYLKDSFVLFPVLKIFCSHSRTASVMCRPSGCLGFGLKQWVISFFLLKAMRNFTSRSSFILLFVVAEALRSLTFHGVQPCLLISFHSTPLTVCKGTSRCWYHFWPDFSRKENQENTRELRRSPFFTVTAVL